MGEIKGALRVHPAETRLTVYRRLSVLLESVFAGDLKNKKCMAARPKMTRRAYLPR